MSSDPQLEILYFFKLVLPGSVPGAGGRRRSQTFGFQRRVWDEKEGPVDDRVQLFRKKWLGFEVGKSASQSDNSDLSGGFEEKLIFKNIFELFRSISKNQWLRR